MKWRHTRETKMNQEKLITGAAVATANTGGRDLDKLDDQETSSSEDDDEIDVVAE